jgi:CDP-diacylglycerol---glycerol-3-phosphate 3-phosphatidyltransferase
VTSETTKGRTKGPLLNVPNVLTSARLVLAAILFVFLATGYYTTGLALFVVAASTDWIDGYWARKYGQVTVLGRILDPFADKMIICGTFIFLGAVADSGVAAWMAVVIMGRELLVTALRSFIEERGHDFSAQTAGKWKMLLQCLAAGASMLKLASVDPTGPLAKLPLPLELLNSATVALVWIAVALTIYSGIGYIIAAVRLMRQ